VSLQSLDGAFIYALHTSELTITTGDDDEIALCWRGEMCADSPVIHKAEVDKFTIEKKQKVDCIAWSMWL